jgi:hypothetical protein
MAVTSIPNRVEQNYIQWATKVIEAALADYERFDDYYRGDHSLEFATDKWRSTFGAKFESFSDNWCQVVVDSIVQRMEITGWDTDTGDNADTKRAEEIWDRNELQIQQDDLHTQALVKGDSYLMCWPSPENQDEAEIYYNDASEVAVYYDAKTNRHIERAAKRYIDERNQTHLFIYYEDHVEKYLIPSALTPDEVAAMMSPVAPQLPGGWLRDTDIPNPYATVPVFHFKNRSLGSTHGLSEIKIVIPIQNAVNKMLMDMMVASEFGSFKQKWVAGGGQPKEGWRTGGDRVWATSDPQAKFGEFGQIDLEPIFKAVEVLIGHIAKVTQTPLFYLRSTGDIPSGEALKSSESGLVKKCFQRQKAFGLSWSKAMSFAIALETGKEPKNPVYPVWKSPETRHDLEQGQVAQLKSILGIPLEQLWREHFGYTDEQVEEFKGLNQAIAASVLAEVLAQIGQAPPGTEQVAATPDQLLQVMTQGSKQMPMTKDGKGPDISQILALLPKATTAQTTAGEATTRPQPNTRPPASPTRRSSGFKD